MDVLFFSDKISDLDMWLGVEKCVDEPCFYHLLALPKTAIGSRQGHAAVVVILFFFMPVTRPTIFIRGVVFFFFFSSCSNRTFCFPLFFFPFLFFFKRSKTSEEDRQSGKSRSSSSSSSGSGAASQERVEAVKEQMETNHRSPYMLWCPVTSETKSFSKSLSPKEAYKSRAR